MDIQEKELLESFLRLIIKNNNLAQKCLKDIKKENRDVALEYCLEKIDNISFSLLVYLDDMNCYRG